MLIDADETYNNTIQNRCRTKFAIVFGHWQAMLIIRVFYEYL